MSNWDFITAFNTEASEWLDKQNLPHPLPSISRMPTTEQITAAWKTFDESGSVWIDGFKWDDPTYQPEHGFKMRGDRATALHILKSICRDCGQLWMYPDTGEPAIIVHEGIAPLSVASFHELCNRFEDSWERFYRTQYGT